MKLPDFNRNWAVTPRAKQDPGSALAKIAPSVAAAGAIGQGVQSFAQAAEVFAKRETDQQVRDGGTKMYTSISDFKMKNAGKQTYTAEELPTSIIPEGLATVTDTDDMGNNIEVPNEKIPAHLVYASLLKYNMDSWVESAASGILDPKAQADFTYAANLQVQKNHTQAVINSKNQQVKYQRNADLAKYGELIATKNYDAAESLVQTSQSFTAKEQQKMLHDTKKKAEYNHLDAVVNSERIDDINATRKKLLDPEYSGPLTETEQRVQAGIMTSAISRLKAGKDSSNREVAQNVRAQYETVSKSLRAGHPVDPSVINDVVTGLGTQGETFEISMMDRNMKISKLASEQAWMGPVERKQTIMELQDIAEPSVENIDIFSALKDADKTNTALQNKDMVAYQRDVLKRKLPPIDFMEPGWIEKAAGRVPIMNDVFKQTHIFNGFLDHNAEMAQLTDTLEQQSYEDKAKMLPQINAAFGEYAPQFYDQLIAANVDTSFAVAGQISSKNGYLSGKAVMMGHDIRKEDPQLISENQMKVDEFMRERLLGAYPNNPKQMGAMKTAFLNTYAYLSNNAGDDRYDWKEDRAQAALQMVTGGTVSYQGMLFPSPEPGFDDNDMSDWVNTRDPSILLSQGYKGKTSYREVWRQVQTGALQLYPRGEGKWILREQGSGYPIKNKGSESPFILNFDPDATTRTAAKQKGTASVIEDFANADYSKMEIPEIQQKKDDLQQLYWGEKITQNFFYTQRDLLEKEIFSARKRNNQWN